MEDTFYCADWDRCGAICEEQCPACKKANNLEIEIDKQDKCPTCGKDYKSEDPIFCSNSFHNQDKTAEQHIIEIYGENWTDRYFQWDAPDVIDVMESYAQHRTAELEAKIKALEEQLKAADEVIAYTEKINFYATHGDVKREYDEALAKYQSLKK